MENVPRHTISQAMREYEYHVRALDHNLPARRTGLVRSPVEPLVVQVLNQFRTDSFAIVVDEVDTIFNVYLAKDSDIHMSLRPSALGDEDVAQARLRLDDDAQRSSDGGSRQDRKSVV